MKNLVLGTFMLVFAAFSASTGKIPAVVENATNSLPGLYTNSASTGVFEPSTVMLLTAGLGGLCLMRRKAVSQ